MPASFDAPWRQHDVLVFGKMPADPRAVQSSWVGEAILKTDAASEGMMIQLGGKNLTTRVLKQSLDVLGIETVEQM